MKLEELILLPALTSCYPFESDWGDIYQSMTFKDQKLSGSKNDLLFIDDFNANNNFKLDDSIMNGRAALEEFPSDCAVVVYIWKSLHGETELSPSTVSPIGCCDDQNSDIRGVRCSEEVGAVIGLEWSSWGKWNGKLAGQLPHEIGYLKSLRILYVK